MNYNNKLIILLLTSLAVVIAEEETIYCDETADCIAYNEYFECKPIKDQTKSTSNSSAP